MKGLAFFGVIASLVLAGPAQARTQSVPVGPAGSAGTEISPSVAYRAMLAQGAAVADGLTLRQAVGLDPLPRTWVLQMAAQGLLPAAAAAPVGVNPAAASPSASVTCWQMDNSHQWGIWPTQAELTDHAYWCGYPQWSLTSWSHSISPNGTLCGSTGTNIWLIQHYAGAPYVQVGDSGTWNCGGLANVSQWMDLEYSSSGDAWIYSHS